MTRWPPIGPHLPHGPEAAEAAGITYRQLDYWTRLGWLNARRSNCPGSGHQREYLPAEIRVAAWMGILTNEGIKPPVAEGIARDLESTGRASLGVLTLQFKEAS